MGTVLLLVAAIPTCPELSTVVLTQDPDKYMVTVFSSGLNSSGNVNDITCRTAGPPGAVADTTPPVYVDTFSILTGSAAGPLVTGSGLGLLGLVGAVLGDGLKNSGEGDTTSGDATAPGVGDAVASGDGDTTSGVATAVGDGDPVTASGVGDATAAGAGESTSGDATGSGDGDGDSSVTGGDMTCSGPRVLGLHCHT